MRILFLSQFFAPEPFFKSLPVAKALVEAGHTVEVLTGFPNYPGGKVYEGHKIRFFKREMVDGVRINRVPLYPSHDASAKRRALNYISFALSASIQGPFRIKRPDVVYIYHPPGTVGLPGSIIRRLFRCATVYDIQDLWPESVTSTSMVSTKSRVGSAIGWWMSMVYKRMDRIMVLSPGFKRALIDRGVPEHKVHVIYNWCDETSMGSIRADTSFRREGRFTLLFAGTMGFAQDLEHVLDAAHICQINNSNVDFVFMGPGVCREALEKRAKDLKLDNTRFLPPRKQNEMGPALAAADALLVHLKDDPLYRITIPSKTQAYLAAGRPILMALQGDSADLVQQAKAGLVCEPGNAEAIAKTAIAMSTLSADDLFAMGQRGLSFYRENLSLEVGLKRMLEVFEEAIQSRHSRRKKFGDKSATQ
jgi:glycosyltransferase involved in cell wall biosynthesis